MEPFVTPASTDTSLLQALIAQQQRGTLSPATLAALSQQFQQPVAEIGAVIDFYAFLSHDPPGLFSVRMSDNIVDQMAGSRALMAQLATRLGVQLGELRADGRVKLHYTACTGMSDQSPALLVNGLAISRLTPQRIDQIANLIEAATPISEWPPELLTIESRIGRRDRLLNQPFIAGSALQRLQQHGSAAILAQIEASQLRGRGGAGFPTGRKWRFCRETAATERVVVCNADEGEPGTFKDRVLLQHHAAELFEGMTLAAGIIGASRGFLYLRGEYRYLLPHLEAELAAQRRANRLGRAILGNPAFNFDIAIHLGAGAYICGEESALIESLEGKRGIPRKRPPFPVTHGYHGLPTVVNNVETFWAAAHIAVAGAEWFCQSGTAQSTGTKLLSISGDCDRAGIYEYPFGVTMAEILYDCGADEVQAVQMAGAAGELLFPDEFNRTLAYEDVATGGSMMIFNRSRNLLDRSRNFAHFFAEESCGFCTPCRVGTVLIRDLIEKLYTHHATAADLHELNHLADLLRQSSHCGLGQSAAHFVVDTLNHLPEWITARLAPDDYEPAFNLETAVSEAEQITGRCDTLIHVTL